MMSDINNLDILLGNQNINPIERGLANAIRESTVDIMTSSREVL